jgi:ATP-dependent helicase/nuclease subunit A
VNYRSAAELVDWVNAAFSPIFPEASSGHSTSPRFRSAAAGRGTESGAGVELHALKVDSYADEIARVVTIVGRELEDDPEQSIGILVRSRTHLLGMRSALADEGLAAHAVEIDSLTDTELGLDLIALTAALLHEGDRLAWLGLLRSPSCGMGWTDLDALCGDEPGRTIRSLLGDPDCLARLSSAGRERAAWFHERLEIGFGLRASRSLGHWIRDCWRLIDGSANLRGESDARLAERYFCDLDRQARDGDIDDPALLVAWFARPTGSETPTGSGIEIMTIHRAKGLEFDTVVLPGLGRTTRGSDSNILISEDIDVSSGRRLSFAAGRAANEPLYAWLRQIKLDQESAERARLLYVATTRAKRRLYLIGGLGARDDRPRSGSLLETLWPGIGEFASETGDATPASVPPQEPAGAESDPAGFIELPLKRLRFDQAPPLPRLGPESADEAGAARPEFEWVHPASVQVGTLIHRELQRLAARAARAGTPVAPEPDAGRYGRELALLGVEAADRAAATARVAEAHERDWADPVGRWILRPWPEAWSELRLTIRGAERLEHIRLDRSFVDEEGLRWIIDYKTGRHLGADVEAFLASEVERYREQLEHYARAVAATDSRPIRVGLYFPLMSCLKDWMPGEPETRSE